MNTLRPSDRSLVSEQRSRWIRPMGIGGGVALAMLIWFAFGSGESTTATEETGKMLRHVVMFQFKESSSPAEIEKVVEAFRALKTKIPEIADFEYGTDNSPEGLANGFTHLFFVTFKSEADRAVYLPHPEHKAFVDILRPHMEKVQVIDYWAKR
jgi:hypothetical protein